MKLLVTGGNGMVGSTIDADVTFASKECDLTNFDETLSFFKKHSPEAVIHCAGKIGGVGINSRLKGEFFYKNTMINTNVLEVSRLVGVKKLVCLLSTCIFPVNANYPLTPDQIHSGEPHPTSLGYSYSKRLAEIQIRTYREQYGVNYVSIVPCNIYVPRDNFKIDEGHVVPSLVHKCYLAKKNNTPLKVWGTGKPQRELLYSQDAGDISMWALIMQENKIKKAVVTGGAGFIGSNMVDKLVDMGVQVTVIDNLSTGKRENINSAAYFWEQDLVTAEVETISEYLKDVDAVFHFAAMARVQPSIEDPVMFNENNVTVTLKLLKACADSKVKRFVLSSSSSIYGDAEVMPTSEELPRNPMSPYAAQKMICEDYCKLVRYGMFKVL